MVAEPAENPPVVDDLHTRLLERRAVVRTYVRSAEVVDHGPTWVVLRTTDTVTRRFSRFADDTEASDELPADGDAINGSMRLDLVADGTVRVRYAQAPSVGANRNPMVVGEPPAPSSPEVAVHHDHVLLTTGEASIRVALKPLTISVTTPDRGEVALIGGREKNQWNLWDSWNTGICRTAAGDPLAVECFALRPQEAIYGFGEQFLALDKVGQTIDVNMVEATGTTTPRSYKNIPFFVSTSGYGVFLNHSCRMTAWVGSMAAADVQVALEDDFLDYYVLLGDIGEVLSAYTDLTGKSHVPPAWSFGWWQSKISYRSAEETLEVIHRMREEGHPVDVLHLDTHWFREDWRCDLEFDPERFPDPAGYLAELAALGVKVCLWQLPYIPEGSRLFDELAAAGGFVRNADGGIYDIGICYTPGWTGGVVGCIDFTNPEGVRVYQEHLRRLFALGARAIKVDFGEQAPLDGVYHDGTPGHRAHNLYPLLYNRAVAEVTAEATGDWIIWARSAWAGSQRYPLHWGGDSSPNWHNLGPQLAGGLSLGLSGFSFWSQDIGGFLGETGGDLLVRWVQAGVFLSHARIHGVGTRELLRFPPEVRDICADYVRLRYRLLPYLLGAAADAVARSVPMARALVVDFQDDPSTWRIADQWMLGDSLLVAPVMDASGRRRVYLPAGSWTDWWTGERVEGRRWIDVKAPLEVLPLYVREGGVIALGPELQHVGERPTAELLIRIAPFTAGGERTLVAVVDGEDVAIRYRAEAGRHTVRVSATGASVRAEVLGEGAPDVELVEA
ncbi:MAG TPA: TIM-barrel domain-containing protein [Acidimicrobiales bacterium]|nr:TIM-barrel domain-containing protein [Acidimicrobiales bacterium]